MRSLILSALVLSLAGLPAAALAGEASPWSSVDGAAVRLLPGDAGNKGFAGLEIKLDEGWKTYWRNPGDAGIPPRFDWSKSENLGDVAVVWPAPTRLDDEGGTTAVYTGDVLMPLRVTPADPSKPVRLALSIDYGICHQICVPVKSEVELTLAPDDNKGEGAEAIADAVKRAPTVEPPSSPSPFKISQFQLDTSTRPATVTIDVSSPSPAWLFVEGPPKWYLPMPNPAPDADKANPQKFVLQLDGLPKNTTLGGHELRFTLSTGQTGVERVYQLP